LFFDIADQSRKARFGERVNRQVRHPASLFEPSFQFLPIAFFGHRVVPDPI
jgi:hypothetical protein